MPLFVVATPIGNLEEASPRMCRVLSEADLVLCEDSRRARTLFAGLELVAPRLLTCHAHNEAGRLGEVIRQLEGGATVALISDAGSPGVSDPGGMVVEAAHRAGIPVHLVAGPSSVTGALSVAGFRATPFHFLGFPPRKAGALNSAIIEASALAGPLVFLESGRRVERLIAALAEVMPDREAVICRELTKRYEEVIRGRLVELSMEEQRGEVVVVVGPGEAAASVEKETGPDLKGIAASLAERWGCTKREAYNTLLALENERSE
jgi:16S rRNA (cytidine1402-2'-O)-methyltransferase